MSDASATNATDSSSDGEPTGSAAGPDPKRELVDETDGSGAEPDQIDGVTGTRPDIDPADGAGPGREPKEPAALDRDPEPGSFVPTPGLDRDLVDTEVIPRFEDDELDADPRSAPGSDPEPDPEPSAAADPEPGPEPSAGGDPEPSSGPEPASAAPAAHSAPAPEADGDLADTIVLARIDDENDDQGSAPEAGEGARTPAVEPGDSAADASDSAADDPGLDGTPAGASAGRDRDPAPAPALVPEPRPDDGSRGEGAVVPGEVAASTADRAPTSKPPKTRRFSLLRETAIVVVTALVLSILIKTFLVQAFYIPSGSMEDTLHEGDRILVSRLVPGPLTLHRGDVVVFKDPGGWLTPSQTESSNPVAKGFKKFFMTIGLLPQDSGDHLVKRVIGLPGDHVTCCNADGLVEVNGTPITETYIKPGVAPSQTSFDVTVPGGMLFVMGDNRSNSEDSRYQTAKPGGGFVPEDNVVGSVIVVMWPFSNAKIMHNPGAVFKNVPAP